MGNRRTLLAAAAILLAAAAGLGVYFYVSGADNRAESKVQTVEAFIAVRDIPKGTTGSAALSQGLIAPARTLRGSVPPAAVTDSSLLDGTVAAATIQARQFITDSSFVAPAQGGGGSLAASIGSKDLVAVTIGFDAARAVANQIAPGDKVDLITGGAEGSYLFRGVKVLAIGTETAATAAGGNGQPSSTAAASGLITFEVTPDQALEIVNASRGGGIYLTLQPLSASTGAGSTVPASGR
ncbi:MAG: Flp pilus assembly protein CpaB [Acidimicrobiia bacterium]